MMWPKVMLIIGGIIFIILAINAAGNTLYNPYPSDILTDNPIEQFRPIATYPSGDPPDSVYNSQYTYIPLEDIYYIEYFYVWLNVSGHTPDTESIRVFIKNGTIDHLAVSVHWQWMDVYTFDSDGSHPIISFAEPYHTPIISGQSLANLLIVRAFWPSLFAIIGVVLLVVANLFGRQ